MKDEELRNLLMDMGLIGEDYYGMYVKDRIRDLEKRIEELENGRQTD